ncbi:MAG: hypothetical protein RLZZ611_1662 [Cyanobacteriota bacterium]
MATEIKDLTPGSACCGSSAAINLDAHLRSYDLTIKEPTMTHASSQPSTHDLLNSQEIALHMITSAARILLMIGTAVLVGEVATGPARRLIAARRHRHASDGGPQDSVNAES